MTEVIQNLFIGNWHEARDAQGMYVVTVAIDSEFIGHEHFKLIDGPGNNVEEFCNAVDSVCKAHRNGDKVLVHCVGGRSRSAAVIVAAVTVLTGTSLLNAYDALIYKHDFTGSGARIHPYLSLILLEKYE